jgi:uncharacterized protein (DUF2384 family)
MQFHTIQPTPARMDVPMVTDEEAGALARATINLFRAWGLTDPEARVLLGDMAPRTWARWKTGEVGRVDRDLRARMAILMGIHKALRYMFADPVRGYEWIRKPNKTLDGQSALDVMMRGEITDLVDLRAYLDAERGAW